MPTLTPLFSNVAGRLFAEPAGYLRVVWRDAPRTLADTQALFEATLHHLQQHNWSRLLVNQLHMAPFNGPEQVWIVADWLPRAVQQGGYRHGAIVISPAILARLATAYITSSAQDPNLVYRSFTTEAEALAWLLQQPATP